MNKAKPKERPGDAIRILKLSIQCKILFQQGTCGRVIGVSPGGNSKPIKSEGDSAFVSKPPKQCQALLGKLSTSTIVALHEGETCGRQEGSGAHQWWRLLAHSQGLVQETEPFVPVASYYPETLQS